MATTDLSSLFSLYELSTGRRLFALAQVVKAADGLGLPPIATHARAALAHDTLTRTLDTRWAARAQPPPLDAVLKPIDAKLDRTLSSLRDAARAQAEVATPADGLAAKVETFLREVFPIGVGAITSLVYVEELSQVDRILDKVRGPNAPLADLVTEIGLTRHVERLAELAEQYRKALEVPKNDLTWGEVRAARARGQNLLLETVALIIAYTAGDTPERATARATLLAPILVQNEAVRQYLRARRRVEDVDPVTGELDLTAPPSGPDAEALFAPHAG
ncbi:uncharacterized protein CMC5_005220 [Chondromyces crocatus]|uniref:Uncharacterized protein n=2 Tax=Chondromyces crocatus TaxID=52 RepID=A0A0K1E6C5_CHOCO|nr:uncharacterized protein CMC5_005220 [Chondromyces crocatus]